MNKFSYRSTCINNPFESVERLQHVTNNAREITRATFLKHCDITGLPMKHQDFKYFKYYESHNGFKCRIYFFTKSGIEYFWF